MELINFELDAISSTEPLDEIVQQRCLVSCYLSKTDPSPIFALSQRGSATVPGGRNPQIPPSILTLVYVLEAGFYPVLQ